MTEKLYSDLIRLAKKRLRRAGVALRYISITDPEDIVHGFFLSSWYDETMDLKLIPHRLSVYCARLVRDGQRRRDAGKVITNSQNFAIINQEGNYRDDDLIDGYIYRHSAQRRRVNPALSDGDYRGASGKIDYDVMLEDMHKEMCKDDRLFCVRNHRTRRTYQCGNPRAIPIELLYGED